MAGTEHTFRVESSQLLCDNPIMALRRDEVLMPGGSVARREIVEHFGAVAIVALADNGQVAMIEQYRHAVGRRLREIPAGLLDIKGESPLQAAQRELAEEAGLVASRWDVLVDIVTSPGFCDESCRIYLARDLAPLSDLDSSSLEQRAVEAPSDDEEADLRRLWCTVDEAIADVFSGGIVNSIAVAGLLAVAHYQAGGVTLRNATAPFDIRPTALAGRRQGPDMKRG